MARSGSAGKPRFSVLVSGTGWHVQDLLRAAEAVGVILEPVGFQSMSLAIAMASGDVVERITAGGRPLNEEDAVLVRMMPPAPLEPVVFRMDLLHRLMEMGVPVVNPPRSVEMAVDKALSLARLAASGVAVPATWVGESPEEALNAFERLSGNVVSKPIFGSEGRGLVRITDYETAWRVAHAMNRLGAVLYFQQFVENDGTDLRVMTINGDILAAMRRKAPAHDWRANVAQGAGAEPLRAIPPEVREIAEKTAAVIGGMILGIDLIRHRDGRWLVLEVNAVPGWRALARVTGTDVAAEWLMAVRRMVR